MMSEPRSATYRLMTAFVSRRSFMAVLPLHTDHLRRRRAGGDFEGPDVPEPHGGPLVPVPLGQGCFELVEHERLRDELCDLLTERPHRSTLPDRPLPQSSDCPFVQVQANLRCHRA